MALTINEMEKIAVELMTGKASGIKGAEADAFRAKMKKDIDFAKSNGYTIEIPHDLEE